MSERLSEQPRRPFRMFSPGVRQLESRLLPSSTAHKAFAVPQVFTHHGDAIQTGSLLGVSVDRAGTNKVSITDGGSGNVRVDWNGGHVHSFGGVETVDVHAQNGRNDQITFNLYGEASAALAVEARPSGNTDTASVNDGGHPLVRVLDSIDHGEATQLGSVLTVKVDDSKGNSVQISDAGSGDIQIAWNRGPAYSFTGVTVILVHAEKARNDQVIFTESNG